MCRGTPLLFVDELVDLLLPLDDPGWLHDLASEDVSLDEVWKPDGQFMADEAFGWDGENLCVRESKWGILLNGFGARLHLRSNSSKVSCLVSRTKQKTMPQAIRLSPA